MQQVFRFVAVLFVSAVVGGPSAQAAASLDALFDDPVIARGKGVEVKRSELENAFLAYKSNLAGRGGGVPENERLAREQLLLDRLIVTQLLTNRAVAADRVKASELVTNLLAEANKDFPSEEALRRRLKVLGVSLDRYTNQIMEQAVAQAVLDRELRSKVEVTNAEIEDFYQTGADVLTRALQAELERLARDPATTPVRLADAKKQIEAVKKANLARLAQPEKVRVSHVMLATYDKNTEVPLPDEQKKLKRTQIEKLRTAALAGEDFQKLIQDYSEDRQLKQTKGEYVLAQDSPFVPEFKVTAFSLQPGQISDIVTTPFGYHILKVSEKIPAQKADLAKVRQDLKALLTEQEVQKRMPEYFGAMKKEAGVQVIDPKYRLETGKDTNPLKD